MHAVALFIHLVILSRYLKGPNSYIVDTVIKFEYCSRACFSFKSLLKRNC